MTPDILEPTAKHTLYLCYFSLREPLVQTQVLPYLREIRKDGIKISLLTFETDFGRNWTKEQIDAQRTTLLIDGIQWYALPYHRSPAVLSTLYDILRGTLFTISLARKEKVDIFHSRGHIPAPIAALAKTLCGGKMLFDIRGFMPEEYTDAGIWKESGYIYKGVKRVEKWLMKKADGFVVLTERAREILFPESNAEGRDEIGRPVEVIPCCIDRNRFDAIENDDPVSIEDATKGRKPVFIYVGSLGGWYLTDEMIRFFYDAYQYNSQSFTKVLTQRDVEKAKSLLSQHLSEKDFLVESAEYKEVPHHLKKADIAISFIKACYSKQSSSPTKIAEYLGAGLPIISNSGVGDLDSLIEGENVGVILKGFSKKDYAEALEKIYELLAGPALPQRCRTVAYKYFDLETVGGPRYRRIYKKLLDYK